MKTILHKIAFLFALIFGLIGTQKVIGSHYLSADITYTQTSANTFNVQLHLIRDCNAGHLQPLTENIFVTSTGCSGNRVAAINLLPGNDTINQNCPQVPGSTCLVQRYTYAGTVTLTAAELNCQKIIFSWSDCCRPVNANTVNPMAFNIYTEATVVVRPNFMNSSPGKTPIQTSYAQILVGSDMVYSVATTDPDCDSVSYELVAPLTAANTPMTYKANSNFTSGSMILNSCPKPPYSNPFNPQYAIITGPASQQFSPVYPLPAVGKVHWGAGPTIPYPAAPGGKIWEASSEFGFEPLTGQMRFNPSFYIPNPSPGSGDNKYLVEVLVKEWRKLNGITTLVGSTRRGVLFTIVDNGGSSPTLANITANGHPIASGDIITLRPGMSLNLNFNTDQCYTNSRTVISTNVADALPGAVFVTDTSASPTGTITWTATPDCGGIRFFQVKVEDDACPVKGFQTHTFGVRVSTTAAVTGMPEAQKTAAASLTAFPNPYSSEVKFRFSTTTPGSQQIFIYNSLGQLIDQLEVSRAEAQQEITWQKAGSQKSGLYIARLVQNGQPVQTIRFTKTN